MKVTTEKLPDSRMLLNIEVDGDEVERFLQKTYKKLVQQIRPLCLKTLVVLWKLQLHEEPKNDKKHLTKEKR